MRRVERRAGAVGEIAWVIPGSIAVIATSALRGGEAGVRPRAAPRRRPAAITARAPVSAGTGRRPRRSRPRCLTSYRPRARPRSAPGGSACSPCPLACPGGEAGGAVKGAGDRCAGGRRQVRDGRRRCLARDLGAALASPSDQGATHGTMVPSVRSPTGRSRVRGRKRPDDRAPARRPAGAPASNLKCGQPALEQLWRRYRRSRRRARSPTRLWGSARAARRSAGGSPAFGEAGLRCAAGALRGCARRFGRSWRGHVCRGRTPTGRRALDSAPMACGPGAIGRRFGRGTSASVRTPAVWSRVGAAPSAAVSNAASAAMPAIAMAAVIDTPEAMEAKSGRALEGSIGRGSRRGGDRIARCIGSCARTFSAVSRLVAATTLAGLPPTGAGLDDAPRRVSRRGAQARPS